MNEALDKLAEAVRASALVPARSVGVVMVSGGPDSACVAAGLAELCGRQNVHAMHVNYALRPTSDEDERACRRLCAALRIDLRIERPSLPEGNVQAAARRVRYEAAERLRAQTGARWIATGHTRTDVVETVLYRLISSPGTRPLLGLPARRGAIVRPLLALEREEVRRLARAAELPFIDDPSNLDRRFARNRIRLEVLPVLRELSRAAERNVAETRAELAEEVGLLERLAAETLEAAGAGAGAVAVRGEALEDADPALARLALRMLAERAAGRRIALSRRRAAEIRRLAREPQGGEVELPGGVRALCEHGMIRFSRPEKAPEPTRLPVPGTARFGRWVLSAEVRPAPVEPAGPEVATLDAAALGRELVVRSWRDGDRIRPLGMGGSKTVGDLFTDRRVPRSLRHSLPVVVAPGGRIAWVAGVAVSEEFRLTPAVREVAVLRARAAE